jgi:TonB family protein
MAGPSSPDSPRKAQPEPDAHHAPSPGDDALGRTLEAELTRAATRANPASLTPSSTEPPAPDAPAEAGSPTEPSSGEAQAHDVDAEDDQSNAPRRPRIGWGGVLALLNVVLSGFILMLWGVPRWDTGRAAQPAGDGAAPANNTGASVAAGNAAGGGEKGFGSSPSSATAAATRAGAGLNATNRPGSQTRATQPGAASGIEPEAAGSSVEVPELPQAIISVMPGQRAPDVTAPPPPRQPAAADDDAAGDAGAVTLGADDAIEAGNAAAQAAGDSGALGIPIAGTDGVTMPERLAESHVRPTIAALADGEPVTGEVRLAATIRVDGSVADVQVLSSSRPGAGLEQAAADAVRRWRYKPATRAGQPIDSRLTITVTFR